MSEGNYFIRFRNSQGNEYEIGLVNDEIVIDVGEGGVLSLESYYNYADAERERIYFEFMGTEIRDSIREAAEHPDLPYLVGIEEEDLVSVERITPRKIEIEGYELLEKRAAACGNSGRIYVPADWIGHRVAVIRLD
ncbi:putative transposon-encoded protein [Methanofollis sp. W23]|uniref:DUF2080 family transposase-associated protein n=1 Tax=Methanofollis sp. W23 TaxID=2817849 RepID=UPI001D3B2FB4|nr:DUF2080 family transposase-associated protein [Methanofollis sp. W23]MBP2147215.1 putative transposon-encoded protein [Methanofollis sp. W23]